MTTESLAFTVFVTLLGGGLAVTTLGMLWIAVVLYRQNRHRFARPARVLPFARQHVASSESLTVAID